LHPQRVEQWLEPMSRRAIYWISLILILFHFKPEGAAPFIYFQF